MITETLLIIHYALHSDQSVVTVNDIDYPILKTPEDQKYIDYAGVRIIQQTKYKDNAFAKRARGGEKITWVMGEEGTFWIDDLVVKSFKNKGQ